MATHHKIPLPFWPQWSTVGSRVHQLHSSTAAIAMPMPLQVLAVGSPAQLCRPCVDCGLYTGRFCDFCLAETRIPSEQWCRHQYTPLCSTCDNRWDSCHFCRGLHWCTPHPKGSPPAAPVHSDPVHLSDSDSDDSDYIWFDEPDRIVAELNRKQDSASRAEQQRNRTVADSSFPENDDLLTAFIDNNSGQVASTSTNQQQQTSVPTDGKQEFDAPVTDGKE